MNLYSVLLIILLGGIILIILLIVLVVLVILVILIVLPIVVLHDYAPLRSELVIRKLQYQYSCFYEQICKHPGAKVVI